MREIKFRGYNKNTKQIEEVKEIAFFKDDFVLKTRDLKTMKMQEQINSSEAELLQYTGLKDKNGKEIYESDIVKIEKCFTNGIDKLSDHIGEIKYINDRYYAVDEYMNCLSPYEYRNSIEVIGNIYENPELLKGVIND